MLLTIVISVLTTLLIGSMLYYTLKRHDVAHAQEVELFAGQVSEQKALAASQIFAALSRQVIQTDPVRIQDLVGTGFEGEEPREVMVVSRDNIVLAAKDSAQVGQRVQDATWLSWKAQNREVARRAVDQAGLPVFVIVEPLKDQGDILAWAMLVFALPQGAVFLRSPTERMVETASLMAPILVFLLVSIGLAMKLATAAIRRQIQGLMASVLEEPGRQAE